MNPKRLILAVLIALLSASAAYLYARVEVQSRDDVLRELVSNICGPGPFELHTNTNDHTYTCILHINNGHWENGSTTPLTFDPKDIVKTYQVQSTSTEPCRLHVQDDAAFQASLPAFLKCMEQYEPPMPPEYKAILENMTDVHYEPPNTEGNYPQFRCYNNEPCLATTTSEKYELCGHSQLGGTHCQSFSLEGTTTLY